MKTYLTYGLGMTLASAALTLAFYFLGYHEDVEMMQSKLFAWVGGLLGLAIAIVGTTLAIRAARDDAGTEGMTYGRGVGAGALTGVFYGLFAGVFQYLYGTVINPEFQDTIVRAQIAAMEAQGMGAQAEQAESFLRVLSSPAFTAASSVIGSIIFCTVIALVASAFLKRARQEPPPLGVA